MAKNFLARAKSWSVKNKLFGPQAFLKYVIFTYVEALNAQSEEFVFKGGNLLWAYIKTPRATVDLDLGTLELNDNEGIRKILAGVAEAEGIEFELAEFLAIEEKNKRGASATIRYKTDSGASNTFGIDIVYGGPADVAEIPSPLDGGREILAASIENIVADKLMAVNRFKAGNTRIKDYDDLWRISRSAVSLDKRKLMAILESRKIGPRLDKAWINGAMESAWANHRARYKGLPEKLEALFREVNEWLR
jgi:hypothetical protein